MIPSEEVIRFLENAEKNENVHKPVLPIVFQRLLNRGLRKKLGLERNTTGVWVRDLVEAGIDYPIRIGDICTHIGEHNIDNRGQDSRNSSSHVAIRFPDKTGQHGWQ